MKTTASNPLRGLRPPNPLGFIAWEPIPQADMHARAAKAARACGIWSRHGARVASQRSPILRPDRGMIMKKYSRDQSLIQTPKPAGRMAGFERAFVSSSLQSEETIL